MSTSGWSYKVRYVRGEWVAHICRNGVRATTLYGFDGQIEAECDAEKYCAEAARLSRPKREGEAVR